jgi:nitrate reductase beta subunit
MRECDSSYNNIMVYDAAKIRILAEGANKKQLFNHNSKLVNDYDMEIVQTKMSPEISEKSIISKTMYMYHIPTS